MRGLRADSIDKQRLDVMVQNNKVLYTTSVRSNKYYHLIEVQIPTNKNIEELCDKRMVQIDNDYRKIDSMLGYVIVTGKETDKIYLPLSQDSGILVECQSTEYWHIHELF